MAVIKEMSVQKLLRLALWLSAITVTYNLIEGVVSTAFGADDETLALFGFGVDSFVEVVSGLGVGHMVWRMRRNGTNTKFEVQALRITGIAFYVLSGALVLGAINSIYHKLTPERTLAGVVIAVISLASMYFLFRCKKSVGEALHSQPIIADAHCTKTCFYLSFILLASSLLYAVFKIPYVDALGSLGIAWYAFKEGKEALGKAKGKACSCCE